MSDHQQLWDNYAACWSADPSRRLTALGAVAVDDVTYRDPGTEVGGLAELDAYMGGFAGAFPGHRFRIDEVLEPGAHRIKRDREIIPSRAVAGSQTHRGGPVVRRVGTARIRRV